MSQTLTGGKRNVKYTDKATTLGIKQIGKREPRLKNRHTWAKQGDIKFKCVTCGRVVLAKGKLPSYGCG